MNEEQKTIYMAMLKARHESLMDEAMDRCQDFGFETPKDMLDDYEAEGLTESVCYDQGYLAGMQFALSLLKNKEYDNELLCEIAYLVGQLGIETDLYIGYDGMMTLYKSIYDKADENKMGGLLQNVYDLFDQGVAKKIVEDFYLIVK